MGLWDLYTFHIYLIKYVHKLLAYLCLIKQLYNIFFRITSIKPDRWYKNFILLLPRTQHNDKNKMYETCVLKRLEELFWTAKNLDDKGISAKGFRKREARRKTNRAKLRCTEKNGAKVHKQLGMSRTKIMLNPPNGARMRCKRKIGSIRFSVLPSSTLVAHNTFRRFRSVVASDVPAEGKCIMSEFRILLNSEFSSSCHCVF